MSHPGGCTIIPPHTPFDVSIAEPVETIHLYIHTGLIEAIAADFASDGEPSVRIRPAFGVSDPYLEYSARSLLAAATECSPLRLHYAERLAQSVAAHLVTHHSTLNEAAILSVRGIGLAVHESDRLREFVRRNITGSVSIAQMAKEVGMGIGRFREALRVTTGQTPHQFVLKLRAEHARLLLAETYKPISDVAHESGFANQTHFARVFKKLVGITPSEFRRSSNS